jgi:hypothetical protein
MFLGEKDDKLQEKTECCSRYFQIIYKFLLILAVASGLDKVHTVCNKNLISHPNVHSAYEMKGNAPSTP